MIKKLELKIPPPLLMATIAVVMFFIKHTFIKASFDLPFHMYLAILFLVLGGVVSFLGNRAFIKAGTTISPFSPEKASQLITDGVYSVSRNPMYLALALMFMGWAFFLSNVICFAGPLALMIYLNRFQISLEEEAMEEKFGEEYLDYKKRVRRWI